LQKCQKEALADFAPKVDTDATVRKKPWLFTKDTGKAAAAEKFDPSAAVAIREALKVADLPVTGTTMRTLKRQVRLAGFAAWRQYACQHREWACDKDASFEDKRNILADFVIAAGSGELSNEKPEECRRAKKKGTRRRMQASPKGSKVIVTIEF